MLQQLRDLFELQRIDVDIRDIDKQLEVLPKKLNELESKVAELAGQIADKETEEEAALQEARSCEGQVQEEALKIRKWEQRLNDIRNQREYLALSREVESSKRANRDLEERISEHKRVADALNNEVEALEAEKAKVEGAAQSERESLGSTMAELEATKTSHIERREQLMPTVKTQLLRKYDFIRSKRASIGIVTVVEGSCQGCNMKLPPQLYNVLQRGDTLEQCPSCSRIIIWDKFLETEENAGSKDENVGEGGSSDEVQASP